MKLFVPSSILSALVLVSLAAATAPAAGADVVTNKSTWEGSAAAGLTLTRGNSKTALASLGLQGSDKWEHNELLLSATLAYGKTGTNTTTEHSDANAQYNRLFTERAYAGLKLDLFHDGIAEIKYRITVAPLVGYYFIKGTNASLKGEVGPAFIYADQGAGTNETWNGYFTARVGERFDWKLNDKAKLWQTAEFLPQVDDLDNYLFNFEIGAEAGLTKRLSLRTVLQDFYNNRPAAGRLKNDVQLIAGVAYKF